MKSENKNPIQSIVYTSASNGDEDIYVMDKEGGYVRRLTHSPAPGITHRTPEWSPDRRMIAFQSNREGPRELYLLTLNTLDIKRLTHSNSACNHPAWSPDGQHLVYTSDRGKGTELWIMDIQKMIEKKISLPWGPERPVFNPGYTPDGTKLAFVLKGGGDQPDSLWNTNLDGSDPVMIGPEGWSIFEFDYSPIENLIVFDAKTSNCPPLGGWDIFKMKTNGTGTERLTHLPAMSSRPKFLSDGKTIVFHSNRYGSMLDQPAPDAALEIWFDWWNQFEICTMDVDGKNVKRLTSNSMRDLHPDG